MAKSKKVDVTYDGKGKYLPKWVRDYALKEQNKAKSFQPCSRCPNPASCSAAGRCLAESFSD